MRPLLTITALLLVGTLTLPAQEPAAAPAADLPIRRVVLYKAGIGYFEHLGRVQGDQAVSIRFTSSQLDDALKSLTAIDLGRGQVTGISYNSVSPFERRLSALRLPLGGETSSLQVLNALRGVTVEVTSGGAVTTGRLLSVEERVEPAGDGTATRQMFALVTDAGEIRLFEHSPAVRVRVADRALRGELGRYLDIVGSAREQDLRSLTIATSGTGQRQLFVSYVSEVPIWKSTYRLVLPSKGQPFLQGWAIVDNTVGEDWTNVELSLVAGAPQSFIQQLSQPYFGRRPVVPLPHYMLREPQTHAATLQQGGGALSGLIVDGAGGVIPGASVRVLEAGREVAAGISGPDGRYTISVPAGSYTVQAALTGFSTAVHRNVPVDPGEVADRDFTLQVGSVSETVEVKSASGFAGGVVAGRFNAPAAPPPPPAPMPGIAADAYEQMRAAPPVAQAGELGEMFEYRLKEPVTLRKNQSALVPIVNAELGVEKVSLWNRASGSGRPLKAIWLTNSSGLTLDGGSLTIVDGDAFAGEGLIEALKPGEKRLVSYAADLGVNVAASTEGGPRRVQTLRARDGVLIQATEERATATYKIRNEGAAAVTMILEHPVRAGWTLVEGQLPVESTASTHRFRVVVDGGKEASLAVREVRPGSTRISVGDIDPAMLAQLTASGFDSAELQKALMPVIEKRGELARADARIRDLTAQRTRIVEDQARVRENMKALRGTSEERQLLQRYTRQLNAQEDTLIEVQRQLEAASTDRDRVRADLGRLIASVSFELTGAK